MIGDDGLGWYDGWMDEGGREGGRGTGWSWEVS